eukprot:SAG31_NODE_41911_length_274_cov_0.577143_1_plen_22_part_10
MAARNGCRKPRLEAVYQRAFLL